MTSRRGLWTALSLVGILGVVIALARTDLDTSVTASAGRANLLPLIVLWITSALAWVALGLGTLTRGKDVQRDAGARAIVTILVVAAAARVVVVMTHSGDMSDDIYRYVYDARNGANGINPYLVRPAERAGFGDAEYLERPLDVLDLETSDFAERWPGETELIPRVNNPELSTIYLPTSQWVFTALGAIIPDRIRDPVTLARCFRFAFSLIDLAVIALIIALLRQRRRPVWWATLYAWHPLPLVEIAGSGHQDIIGIAFLLFALWLFGAMSRRRVEGWSAALAVAACVKPMVVPIAPFLLLGRGAGKGADADADTDTVTDADADADAVADTDPAWRRWLVSALVGLATVAILSAPLFLGNDGAGLDNLRDTASRFSLKWAHFGPVYEPLLALIEGQTTGWTNDARERLARIGLLGLLGVVYAMILWRRRDPLVGTRDLLFAMVILSTTAHPWYMLWALALVPIVPSLSVWIASITILLAHAAWAYHVGDDGGLRWGASSGWMIAAWVPVALALVWEMIAGYRVRARMHTEPHA